MSIKPVKYCPFCGNKDESIASSTLKTKNGVVCSCPKCQEKFVIDPIIVKSGEKIRYA